MPRPPGLPLSCHQGWEGREPTRHHAEGREVRQRGATEAIKGVETGTTKCWLSMFFKGRVCEAMMNTVLKLVFIWKSSRMNSFMNSPMCWVLNNHDCCFNVSAHSLKPFLKNLWPYGVVGHVTPVWMFYVIVSGIFFFTFFTPENKSGFCCSDLLNVALHSLWSYELRKKTVEATHQPSLWQSYQNQSQTKTLRLWTILQTFKWAMYLLKKEAGVKGTFDSLISAFMMLVCSLACYVPWLSEVTFNHVRLTSGTSGTKQEVKPLSYINRC